MSDRGARALAERASYFGLVDICLNVRGVVDEAEAQGMANGFLEDLLGDAAMFIPDVEAHEPFDISSDGNWLLCKCGHQTHVGAGDGLVSESYFDHIGAAL